MTRLQTQGGMAPSSQSPKNHLFSNNSAVDHRHQELSELRQRRYEERVEEHSRLVAERREREAEENRHRLILKKREQAESRFTVQGQRDNDNRLKGMWSDPMKVLEALRERARQKPHLLTNMFPPADTNTHGLITEDDFRRGLLNMGFDLPPQKLQLVLTMLGLKSAFTNGRSVSIASLKNAVLSPHLEQHHEDSQWKSHGDGSLRRQYSHRAETNTGDPAMDIIRSRDASMSDAESYIANRPAAVILTLSDNARLMLNKITDRFSTVRRAFRTMDKDKSGALTRIELKNVLDTFCMEVGHDEFDELMNFFDKDHDGLISYEEFLNTVRNEIQPQMYRGDDSQLEASLKPSKPSSLPPSKRRPRRQLHTEHRASYHRPGYLPLKTLDELKIYHDFLKKIASSFHSVREAFMGIDIHREGYITRDELKAVLDNFAFRMSNEQFEAMVNIFDQNHDGKISYEEFLEQVKFCDDKELEDQERERMREMLEFDESPEAQRRLQQLKNRSKKLTSYEFLMEKIWEKSDSIHQAFKQMDTDRSGSLSAAELKAVLDSYCYRVPDEIFANMLALFDADGDGEISFHEFMTQVKRSVGESGYNQDLNIQTVQPEKSVFGSSGYDSRASEANKARNRRKKTNDTLVKILHKIEERHSTVRAAFRKVDRDNSGSLDPEELRSILESTGYKIDDDTFIDILAIFDKDQDGQINYREFLAQVKDIMQGGETDEGMGVQLSKKEALNRGRQGGIIKGELTSIQKSRTSGVTAGAALRFLCEKIHEKWGDITKSFRMLDWDKSGTIGPDELRAVLDDCCYTVSDDVFQQVVECFDEDGDGQISYHELLDKLKRVVSGEDVDVTSRSQRSAVADDRMQKRRNSFRQNSYEEPPRLQTSGDSLPSRFDSKINNIPNLGHGHLHICKAIESKYAVIHDALKRLDYDRKFFISVQELKAAVETYCGRVNPVLWDDILCFFDPSVTGLVDYEKFLNDVRSQVNVDVFEDANFSLRQGFGMGSAGGDIVHHHSMQTGSMVKSKGSAMGMGAHGSNDVAASLKFLCEKIYEKFPSIRNAFMSLDQDRGGTIGKRELKNILDDCCYTVPDEVFEQCYRIFDTDGDGEISYTEFMNQVKNIVEPGEDSAGGGSLSNMLIQSENKLSGHKGVQELYKTGPTGPDHSSETGLKFLQKKLREQTESVRTAFRMFDYDQTGSVSKSELRRILDNYCYKMSDTEFNKLMNMLDENHDGQISYEEFMHKIGSEISYEAPHKRMNNVAPRTQITYG